MKIVHASDLHFEINGLGKAMGKWEPGEVLALTGDIITAFAMHPDQTQPWARSTKQAWKHMVDEVFPHYKKVFLLMGNHDHYHFKFQDTEPFERELIKDIPNVSLLENGASLVGGVLFLGCTLWTDMLKNDPMAKYQAKQGMNDYRVIYNEEGHPITPDDTVKVHEVSKNWLTNELKENQNFPTVVLTHHCPTFKSIGERHRGSQLNHAYASDLSELILENPQIKYWLHGHTHDSMKYQVGDTTVFSNQCGYQMDPSFYHFKPKGPNSFVEI